MNSKEFITEWKAVPENKNEDNIICRMVYLQSGDAVFCTDYRIMEDKADNYYDEVKLYYGKSSIAVIRLSNIKHVVLVFRESD